ncbi:MAG: dihydroorotase [Phycisphaeraceae bacterium]|nr:dihydroorotase [Phycisphaeraceae bacterium]
MPSILITGGRLIDPASNTDRLADVAIRDGRIAAVSGGDALARSPADRVISAKGCIVAPGLIDPHVHLREPGKEEAETIATGTAAAVAGGFTTVCCMPNTDPAIDDDAVVEFIFKQAERTGVCRVFPVGAVSKARKGEELAQIGLMARAGAVGFSDDGDVVASAGLMHRALAYIKPTGLALMQHCQEPTLTRGASMHAGTIATRLGLVGWPRIAEEIIIERDIRLNRSVGCRYHVQHLSSGGSVEIIRRARIEGQPVTAEASPHHLLLTHEQVEAGAGALTGGGYWTGAKMNPPLRERLDIAAMLEGIADGTITVLATDHAPHTAESKQLDFESAPFGIIGLETALALYIEALVTPGVVGWARLIAMMTVEPAALCGLGRLGLGRVAVGGPGDLTLINPDLDWTISAADLAGKSANTPFLGRRVRGRAVATIVGGEVRLDRLAS